MVYVVAKTRGVSAKAKGKVIALDKFIDEEAAAR